MSKGVKGIDVSYANGTIDWEKVADAGIEWAMIRIGYCYNNGKLKVDTHFHYNIQQATAAGLNIGVYLFSYALTAQAAGVAADEVIHELGPYQIDLPLVFDIEDSSAVKYTSFSKDVNTAIIAAFLSKVDQAGYVGMIYANKSFFETNLVMSKLPYEVWVAQWANECTYKGDYGIWQYSETGKVEGIDTFVDMNIMYKDYPALIGFDEDETEWPVDEPPEEEDVINDDQENVYYMVIKNDNLTKIAKMHGVPLQLLIKVNPQIKNPNLIYPGDKIRIPAKEIG